MPRPRLVACLLALLALAAAGDARAEDPPRRFRLEATFGAGWRTSLDTTDRSPSFECGGVQVDAAIGPVWGALALMGGVRLRVGAVVNALEFQDAAGDPLPLLNYVDVTANVGVQFALDERIRVRLGGDGGGIFVVDHRAPVLGGFLAFTFDAVEWTDKNLALIFVLRADVEAVLTDDDRLPKTSTSFGAGLGVRY